MKRQFFILLLVLSLDIIGPSLNIRASEPEPGVARVSLINGDVSTMRGDSGDWAATAINAPVVSGDKISTGSQSRTEIQLDYANILRLDQQAEARIADLTRTHIQVQVAQGLVNLTVLKGSEADIEIDTPNVAVRPLSEGIYRIQVNSDSVTEVIIRKGEAEISTSQGSTRVRKNDLITIRGLDNPEYQIARAPRDDVWDDWNDDRDHAIKDAQSWRHTNSYYTGAYELDRYGHWENVPGYDWVWTPNGGPDWVPYRSGRWVWEPYWGWTWVSYEPWGWAPYHYGRWFCYRSSWYWWPGPDRSFHRPIWAPAYVSFIGFGFGSHHWSFGLGYGYNSIGWVPVGPSDYYYPWHGHRNSYTSVNITNITNITNVRNVTNITNVNRGDAMLPLADPRRRPVMSNVQTALTDSRVGRSVTAVSAEDFVSGRAATRAQMVNATTLRQGQLVQGTVPVVPTRESLKLTDRPANNAPLSSRAAVSERFFTKRQPPAGPQPFATRAAELQQMVQKGSPAAPDNRAGQLSRQGERRALTSAQPAAPAVSGNAPVRGTPTANPVVNTPVRTERIDQRNRTARPEIWSTLPAASGGSATSGAPGWQRFGQRESINVPQSTTPTRTQEGQPNRESVRPVMPSRIENQPRGTPSVNTLGTQRTDRSNTPAPAGDQGNWRRFGSVEQAAPSSRPQLEQRQGERFSRPESAPAARSGQNDLGSRTGTQDRYNRSSTDERSYRSFPPRSESTPAPRQEMRTPERRESPAYREPPRRSESSRSYERPPLQMQKPIVTERSSRSNDSGARSTRSESRPAAQPSRSNERGRR